MDHSWHIETFNPTGSAIGFEVTRQLDSVTSEFQKIDVYETTQWGNLMIIDGQVMMTSKDIFVYHEMIAHSALLTHPKPRRVVIIGGGDCGTLTEVLKHQEVESVTQCDIDKWVTTLSERHFPELCQENGDPRAEIIFADGLKYIAEIDEGSIDVLIVDSTDPVGPAKGLFNRSFYEHCFKGLASDGVLIQQSESPLMQIDLINEMRGEMRQAGFDAFATLPFPQPCYPTGWWSVTMARKAGARFDVRLVDAEHSVETLYYTPEVHAAALASHPFLKDKLV